MVHAVGTDLGGVRTVERLRDRCTVDELTDCWHWAFGKSHSRPRVIIVHPVTGKHLRTSGTRAAWILGNGRDVPKGRLVRLKCRSLDCCNPEHMLATTRAELGRHMAKVGACVTTPISKVRITRKARATRAKITIEIAREIRASDRPSTEEAKARGICRSLVNKIRAGERWKESAVVASVFHLGAGV